jgi:hypothetical protein
MAQYHNIKHLSAAATATMNQQLHYAMGKAAASAFSGTFKVVVVMAIAGTVMGLVLRRNRARSASGHEARVYKGRGGTLVSSSFYPNTVRNRSQ